VVLPPAFRRAIPIPTRDVPLGELSDGPLLAASDPDIRHALAEEQMAILNGLRRMRAETDERVNGLLEITKAKAIGRIRLRSRATGTAVTQTGRGRR
jgi:hypothetical protein